MRRNTKGKNVKEISIILALLVLTLYALLSFFIIYGTFGCCGIAKHSTGFTTGVIVIAHSMNLHNDGGFECELANSRGVAVNVTSIEIENIDDGVTCVGLKEDGSVISPENPIIVPYTNTVKTVKIYGVRCASGYHILNDPWELKMSINYIEQVAGSHFERKSAGTLSYAYTEGISRRDIRRFALYASIFLVPLLWVAYAFRRASKHENTRKKANSAILFLAVLIFVSTSLAFLL